MYIEFIVPDLEKRMAFALGLTGLKNAFLLLLHMDLPEFSKKVFY